MVEDIGTARSTALQRAADELSTLLACDADHAEYISAQAELRLLALLMLLRGRSWIADDIETLEQLRTDWFLQRPWYHRVPIDVAVSIASGRALPDEFYVNLWVGNSGVRNWLIEVAWLVREQLDASRALHELGRSVEGWQLGAWPGLLRWLLERHGRIAFHALRDYEPRSSLQNYQRRLTRFFADGEGLADIQQLDGVESQVEGDVHRWLGTAK